MSTQQPLLLVLIAVLATAILKGAPELDTGTAFLENRGQVVDQNYAPNPDVLFLFSGPGYRIQLRKTGYSYELYSSDAVQYRQLPCAAALPAAVTLRCHRVDVEFQNSNADCVVLPEAPLDGVNNYYTYGHDAKDVRSYRKVTYKNVYPFTDIEFIAGGGPSLLKYNIILHPGADLQRLRFLIKGASALGLEAGHLVIGTSEGSLKEDIPLSFYTDSPAKDQGIEFQLHGNELSFSGTSDPRKTLVIDPSSNLIWSTYYSGWSMDITTSMASDSQGNVYFAGHTLSTNNMATAASYQSILVGSWDGLLVKFNSNGQRQWATYFGGSGIEQFYALTIDKTDAIYVVGDTGSPGNIASQGAFQTQYGGGVDDMLLVRFAPDGQRIWATYYGGAEHEFAQAVTVDPNGDVIIAGHTGGSTSLSTPGVFNPLYNFMEDGVIAKFSAAGQRLWCSYYGDSGNDIFHSVCVDEANNIYATGITNSLAGISTGNGHQAAPGGASDAFLVRFDATGATRSWATYFGGQGNDQGNVLRYAANGHIYLGGNTASSSGIATGGAAQSTLSGSDDGFLACFTHSGSCLWSSYFGGNGTDYLNDMKLDVYSNLFFCGQTTSTNGIASASAYQPTLASSNDYDAYFAKWTALGQPKLGTYFGTPGGENATGLALDASGKVYLSGTTSSTIGLATGGAHQVQALGSGDLFLAKFCSDIDPMFVPGPVGYFCVPGTYSISAAPYLTYLWSTGATVNPIVETFSEPGVYTYSLAVSDAFGCTGGTEGPGVFTAYASICHTGVDEAAANGMPRVYPVPATTQLNLAELKEEFSTCDLRVYASDGRQLPVRVSSVHPPALSVEHLAPGVYLLLLQCGTQRYNLKFVKQ